MAELERLTQQDKLYPCACSRKEINMISPSGLYPGTCRHGIPLGKTARSLRLKVETTDLEFTDAIQGLLRYEMASDIGDFVLRRAEGLFAYQLAVVVDDAVSGVNQVVRGADLLSSTPRQIYLHACLGTPVPDYVHLPLATDATGQKISKRHGGIADCWQNGLSGTLCRALAFLGQPVPADLAGAVPAEILAWAVSHFDVQRVPAAHDGLGAIPGKNR